MQRQLLYLATALTIVGVGWYLYSTRLTHRTTIAEVAEPRRYFEPIYPASSLTKKYGVVYSNPPLAGTRQNAPLTLDIYYPVDTSVRKPTLILYNGGGFYGGDTGIFREGTGGNFGWGTYFSQRGYVVIAANYRKADHFITATDPILKNVIAMTVSDAQSSIRWARLHASEYGIDPNRIALGGTSAGAVIALSTAYTPTPIGDNTDNQGPSHTVQATIALAGAVHPDTLTQITAGMPPALMLHGDADPLVPYSWALDLKNTLVARGIRADWHPYPGADHKVAGYYTQAQAYMLPFLAEVLGLGLASPMPSSPRELISPSPSPSASPKTQNPADLNYDGQVDRADYEIFRTSYQNGRVDIYAYNELVSNYGR